MLVASLVAKSARSSWAFIACDLELGLFLLVFALPGPVLIQWIQMPKMLFVAFGSLAFKRCFFFLVLSLLAIIVSFLVSYSYGVGSGICLLLM